MAAPKGKGKGVALLLALGKPKGPMGGKGAMSDDDGDESDLDEVESRNLSEAYDAVSAGDVDAFVEKMSKAIRACVAREMNEEY